MKFFHTPQFYCVTTLPIKTNTTANIGVKCLHFSRMSCCRSEYLVWGRQGWSSSMLGRKLTAHYTVLQYRPRIGSAAWHQSNMSSLYRWALQQDAAPAHTARTTMDYLNKEHINFIEPYMWLPNSADINPVDYTIWGAHQQRVYHRRQFKTVEELKRAIVTECQKLSQRFVDNSVDE